MIKGMFTKLRICAIIENFVLILKFSKYYFSPFLFVEFKSKITSRYHNTKRKDVLFKHLYQSITLNVVIFFTITKNFINSVYCTKEAINGLKEDMFQNICHLPFHAIYLISNPSERV